MKRRRQVKLDRWQVIPWVIFILFIGLFIYPICRLFINSFYVTDQGFTLRGFQMFFSKTYYTSTLLNSLYVTSAVTISTTVLGTAFAYLMHRIKIKGDKIIQLMITVSILSPPFIGAYAWIILLGRNGLVTKGINQLLGVHFEGIYGFFGIVLVLTLNLFPLVYLFVSGALKNVDQSLIEAALSLGSFGIHRSIKIVLPLILPTILSAALLVFMRSLADFGTPMLIGEGFQTLPVLIYRSFVSEVGNDLTFAASVSMITIVITVVIFLLQTYVTKKKSIEMTALSIAQPQRVKGMKNVLAHCLTYIVVFFLLIPQLVVVYTSFLKTEGIVFTKGFSFNSYHIAFTKMGTAIKNTYLFSGIAIVLVVMIGVMIAYLSVRKVNFLTNTLDTLQMVPYITPGTIFGIALLYTFNTKPLLLSGTATIMIIAFVIRRLPFTVRSSAAILRQIHPNIEEVSQSLGASPFRTFRKITLPIMSPGVISGAVMSWMTVISELSASVLLYVSSTRTLTIAIYTEVIRGNFGVAAALSTILTITTMIVLFLFFKISGKREIDL